MDATVTTAAFNGDIFLDTILCNELTTCEAAKIGSLHKLGEAPCPPLPMILTVKVSAADITGPGTIPIQPTGFSFQTCNANTTSGCGPCRIPSVIILSAPPSPSSA